VPVLCDTLQRSRKVTKLDTAVLSVDRLNKRFGGIVAVKDMTFEVQAGEVLGLMGPNGAGKTTLLNLIAGVYPPDSGRVLFQGKDITRRAPHKICHLGIARTYQIPQPFTHLLVRDNLLVAATYGSKKVGTSELDGILDLVDLSKQKGMLAGDLATVSLKRLELARALAANPKLVLLDEVAAGSTDAEIPRILAIIKQVRKMVKAIILVEHVMKVMVEAVDRIVVMDKGEKIAEGAPDQVMNDEKVMAAYFG
jgi:branched-chain amino acid transport system ATP-binding protein